jgi:hypothetical protein
MTHGGEQLGLGPREIFGLWHNVEMVKIVLTSNSHGGGKIRLLW